jgi:hypothetical protein
VAHAANLLSNENEEHLQRDKINTHG